jgi:hypothetical protein
MPHERPQACELRHTVRIVFSLSIELGGAYLLVVSPLLDLYEERAALLEDRRLLLPRLPATADELPALRHRVEQLRAAGVTEKSRWRVPVTLLRRLRCRAASRSSPPVLERQSAARKAFQWRLARAIAGSVCCSAGSMKPW